MVNPFPSSPDNCQLRCTIYSALTQARQSCKPLISPHALPASTQMRLSKCTPLSIYQHMEVTCLLCKTGCAQSRRKPSAHATQQVLGAKVALCDLPAGDHDQVIQPSLGHGLHSSTDTIDGNLVIP